MDSTMPLVISNHKPKYSWGFDAIGTRWAIETSKPVDALKKTLLQRIDLFDATYSRFRSDSVVSKVAEKSGAYHFTDDSVELIQFYRLLYEMTDGAVSPLIGGLLVAAGYDKDYSLISKTPNHVPKWDEVMIWKESTVTTTRPLTLDFGAAGKGYLVDILAGLLEKSGINEYIIDASGDIRVKGYRQIIGLENPYDPSEVIGSVAIENASICASSSNRRRWGQWHHIVDPRSLKPVDKVVASWVIAPTTMEADGLATALFFVSPEKLEGYESVRLMANGKIERSPGFMGELYI